MAIPGKYLIHNVETGFHRLMEAPKDLPEHAVFSPFTLGIFQARVEYRAAFSQYLKDIAWAVDQASAWWVAVVDSHVETAGDFDEGLDRRPLWPAGPSANDHFVSTVREYWLKVCSLGEGVEHDERVAPEVFMLGWLADRADLTAILTGMPYWPIGLDENGELVLSDVLRRPAREPHALRRRDPCAARRRRPGGAGGHAVGELRGAERRRRWRRRRSRCRSPSPTCPSATRRCPRSATRPTSRRRSPASRSSSTAPPMRRTGGRRARCKVGLKVGPHRQGADRDRRPAAGMPAATAQPQPFRTMPIVWERAYGGTAPDGQTRRAQPGRRSGSAAPLGRSGGADQAPNITIPASRRRAPRTGPRRPASARSGGAGSRASASPGPTTRPGSTPSGRCRRSDFDPRHHLCAPADQQSPALAPGGDGHAGQPDTRRAVAVPPAAHRRARCG